MGKFIKDFRAGKPSDSIKVRVTRKELRKEKRSLKKQARIMFYENKKRNNQPESSPGKSVVQTYIKNNKSNSIENEGPKTVKKVRFAEDSACEKKVNRLGINEKPSLASKTNKSKMQIQRKRQLLDAVKIDEKEIKSLEKRLKLNKRKNKSTSRGFVECGLDYILDVCDSDKIHSAVSTEVNFDDSDSDFFEDVSFVKGESKNKPEESNKSKQLDKVHTYSVNSTKELKGSSTTEPESDDFSGSELGDNYLSGSELGDDYHSGSELGDDYHSGSEVVDQNGLELDDSSQSKHNEGNNSKNTEFREDIYGRLRDSKGRVIQEIAGKYIPPQLRSSENDEVVKARKQLKGLLNRLAQSNMYSIINTIEGLYAKNSRNAMNEIIIELVLNNLVSNILSPQLLISDHAMLIAVLHANIGSEIGAFMLQRFVESFNLMLSQQHQVENKQSDNILYLISYLYNFKIFESCLMYDMLNQLCIDCTEKNVDLILVVLKSVGFCLRRDDPNAMKQFLLNVQKKCNQLSVEENSRMKYLLSVLINIKNNNISKLSEFDPSQHEQHQKVLKSLIRKGNSIVALRIGLEDLLKVKERGRWWLVGSAWKAEDDAKTVKYGKNNKEEKYSAQLLELARNQRMNTDNRRNIFCILMTAEDYQDAFEKVLRLGLKGQQVREIPLVIVHCMLQEKNFNPFYGLVADELCTSDRRHQMSLQCALWDKFRDLESLTPAKTHLLAQFLAQLLIAGSLPISVLKVIEFNELDKQHIRLLRQIILSIANEKSIETIQEVFFKVSKSKKLTLFREAMKLFIHHFILRNMAEGELRQRLVMISSLLVQDDN